jgi:hypothetical protein
MAERDDCLGTPDGQLIGHLIFSDQSAEHPMASSMLLICRIDLKLTHE